MLYRIFLILLFVVVFSISAQAGEIHPVLYDQMMENQSDYQHVVIRLNDRMNKERIEKTLSVSSYTRQSSHALTVRTLQEHARVTQESLLDLLKTELKIGRVKSYKSFWIDNLIQAEIKTELIYQIANFAEVEMIFPIMNVSIIEPIDEPNQISQKISGVGDNLKAIGADSMWNLGYTGQGTIACNLDTGVEGDHPALSDNYLGSLGFSHVQCWFNPIDDDTIPHTFPASNSRSHGTQAMSIQVGKNDTSGDTLGVAFGANWIAAGVTDIANQMYILDGFQWAADPDGDPNTVDDVPDVVSCSWGYEASRLACDDYFYGVIDNVEATGAVVVFAAGNDGSNYRTLRNPGNRADNAFNSFCVGMISNDYVDAFVDVGSSRGPSICNPGIIKPNVVAPGKLIRVATLNGLYTNSSGTSFACPHVAGAVLLLREYNPNAPVDSIKFALMQSATDIDETGPDSAAGYGLINIPTAMEMLVPNDEPNIYVKSVAHQLIQPGNTVDITVELKNNGLGLLDVTGLITSSNSDLTLIGALSDFGNMAMDAVSDNSTDPYRIIFSSDIPEGSEINVDLEIQGSGGYQKTIQLYFLVGNTQENKFFTHDSGAFKFTVSGIGHYGFAPGSINDQGGDGYQYPQGSSNDLYGMGFLIAADSQHVSNAVRNVVNLVDEHFKPAPGGQMLSFVPSTKAAEHTLSVYTDEWARYPMGLNITQKTYSFDTPLDDHIMLMVYIIKNISDSTLSNIHVATFADWDLGNFMNNLAGYDTTTKTGYMWDNSSKSTRGIAVLNPEGVKSYRGINRDDIYSGFSDQQKWLYMTEDTIITFPDDTLTFDYSHIISTGAFSLAAGASDTAAFAIIAADSISDLLDLYVPAAQVLYADFLTDIEGPAVDPVLPQEFDLAQNYPNPFNPETVISFDLDREQHITLEIINILGQKVETVLDKKMPAGQHKISWSSENFDSKLASGVYFYRLSGEDQTLTRKMILLK